MARKEHTKQSTEKWHECFLPFHMVWKEALISDASVYNGLFGALWRVAQGEAKKPEKVISEWCVRTENHFGSSRVTMTCRKKLFPAAACANDQKCRSYAQRLLKAAKAAGIYPEAEKEIILTEKNISAYIEWDGSELFDGDRVSILNPAWYQNGKMIEQGYCNRVGG